MPRQTRLACQCRPHHFDHSHHASPGRDREPRACRHRNPSPGTSALVARLDDFADPTVRGNACGRSALSDTQDPSHSPSSLLLTAFTLNISVLHLGRPAYAWRALKMWRRSWLSREVLLFGLFFAALVSTHCRMPGLTAAYNLPFVSIAFAASAIPCALLLESRASSPARTSILFLRDRPGTCRTRQSISPQRRVSRLCRGSAFCSTSLTRYANLPVLSSVGLPHTRDSLPCVAADLLLQRCGCSITSFALCAFTTLTSMSAGHQRRFSTRITSAEPSSSHSLSSALQSFSRSRASRSLALPVALAGVITARYLFFVSVVPLNMASPLSGRCTHEPFASNSPQAACRHRHAQEKYAYAEDPVYGHISESRVAEHWVKTTCGYCSVGCGMLVGIRDNKAVAVRGNPDHPVNRGKLCPKGLTRTPHSRRPGPRKTAAAA